MIYNQDGCHGGNASPALSWRHAPAGTASYALTVFDADAPGRGWWHWAVANIPATVDRLPENASASGALAALGAVQARNDYEESGYSGPCPPPGKVHHYVVTIFAIGNIAMHVGNDRPAFFFDHEIRAAVLSSASLTVTYGR